MESYKKYKECFLFLHGHYGHWEVNFETLAHMNKSLEITADRLDGIVHRDKMGRV